jgi:cysteine protease ATG4
MHQVGRDGGECCEKALQVRRIVAAFHDSHASPFSVHAICQAGAAYGLVAGRWMGPYAICRALSDIAVTATEPYLSILTLDSGGGAPCVDPDMCALLTSGPAMDVPLYAPRCTLYLDQTGKTMHE